MINAKHRLQQLCHTLTHHRVAQTVIGLVVLYLLFAFFAVNPLAKKLIPYIAEHSLASKASVSSVTFNPFQLKTTINDFNLTTQRDQPLARFKKLEVDVEISGMFNLAWQFKQIGVVEPRIDFTLTSDGQFNWGDLIAKLNENKAPPSDTIPRLVIEQMMVSQGRLQYEDANRAEPIKTTLTPLNFELAGFSTLPKDRGDYFISAAFANNGGTLKWKGDMSVNPIASKGVVALNGIKIAQLLQLIKGLQLPVAVSEGELQTSFNYDFSLPATIPTLAIDHFTMSAQDVVAKLTQGEDVTLGYAAVSTPSLRFVKDDYPALQIDQLDIKLAELQLSQAEAMQVTLKESAASLSQLAFTQQEAPQLSFADANIRFSDLMVNQDKQFLLTVPQATVSNVSFDLTENKIGIKEMALSNVQFDENPLATNQTATKPLATLANATMTESVIALQEKTITAQSVLFSGLNTTIAKAQDLTLNWVKVFASKQPASTPQRVVETPETDSENKWQVAFKKIALADGNFHIQDNSVPIPMVMDIEKAELEIQDASLDMTKALPIKVAFNIKQGGQLRGNGRLWPSPFKADVGLRLSNLALKPFASYLDQVALLKLKSGVADVAGKLHVQQKKDIALVFNGKFDVKQLALFEKLDDQLFLRWDHLRSDKLSVSLMPNRLNISTLQVVKPSGKFIINPDKSLNFKRVLRRPAEPAPTPELTQKTASTTSSTETFPINIDAIRVSDAKLAFADLSLTPQFGTNIHSLNGVINGLSTQAGKVAQMELDGKVDEYGSAHISGSLQPFNATEYTDIKLAFVNIDMNRLTPYSGKFAGRRIDAGKLSVDLEYKIKQQQLVGTNKFVINQLKLGEKVESTDAADLPLDLAIAILEDNEGIIDLDLPISGSLNDPTFSYTSIFWKAFRNVLTKIVTAPFRVLGKLFGGSDENFDGIQFEAGVSEISPPELEKLAKVSEALAKRQGLALGIVPSYHLTLDTQAIKQITYRQQVVNEMGIQLEPGQKPGPIDLSNQDVQAAIDALYNDLTNKGLLKRVMSKLQTPEEGHYEKAQAQLIDSIEVTEADLTALAKARAGAIQATLLTNGVRQDRISILEMAGNKENDDIKTELKLTVKK